MNLPDFQLPVPANPPDAGTVIAVQFGQDWIPAILTVLETLRDETVWNSPPSDIIPQVDELINRMQSPVIIQPQNYPRQWLHFHRGSRVITGNALALTLSTGIEFGELWSQSPAALNDEFAFFVPTDTGNYTVTVTGNVGTTSGIITVRDSTLNSCTIDLYNGSAGFNVQRSATLNVGLAGNNQIHMKIESRNALSTGYNCILTCIEFYKQ